MKLMKINYNTPGKIFVFSSIFASFLNLISSVLMARLFSVEDFGFYYSIVYSASLIYLLISLNLDTLIPYLKNKKELVFIFNFCGLFFTIIGLILLASTTSNKIGQISLVIAGLFITRSNLNLLISLRLYKKSGFLKVSQTFVQILFKLIGSIPKLNVFFFISDFLQSLVYLRTIIIRKPNFYLFIRNNKILLKKHIRFGMPQGLIDSGFEYIVPLFIAFNYGEYAMGLVIFLFSKLQAIAQIISQSFSQYFGSEFRFLVKESRMKIFKRTLFGYVFVFIFIYTILYFFGELIIIFLFSEKWIDSLIFLKYGVILIMFKYFSAFFGFIPILFQLQEKSITFSILRILALTVLIFFSIFTDLSLEHFWIFFSLIVSCVSFFQIKWYYNVLSKSEMPYNY